MRSVGGQHSRGLHNQPHKNGQHAPRCSVGVRGNTVKGRTYTTRSAKVSIAPEQPQEMASSWLDVAIAAVFLKSLRSFIFVALFCFSSSLQPLFPFGWHLNGGSALSPPTATTAASRRQGPLLLVAEHVPHGRQLQTTCVRHCFSEHAPGLGFLDAPVPRHLLHSSGPAQAPPHPLDLFAPRSASMLHAASLALHNYVLYRLARPGPVVSASRISSRSLGVRLSTNAIVRSLSHGEVTCHRPWTFPFASQDLKSSHQTPIMTIELPDKMYPTILCKVKCPMIRPQRYSTQLREQPAQAPRSSVDLYFFRASGSWGICTHQRQAYWNRHFA